MSPPPRPRRIRPQPAPIGRLERARRACDHLLHHMCVEIGLLGLILLSVALLVVEVTLGGVRGVRLAGDALTALFAVELSLRFWVARSKTRFFARYWVDILAVLPLVRPLRVFRVLRLLRLLRAGVLFRRRAGSRLGVFLGSTGDGATIAGTVVTLVLAAAIVLQGAEIEAFDEALWFSVLSLVGGEPIGAQPRTTVGLATTLALMLGGMTVFGVFVGAVSAKMMARLSDGLGVREMAIDELREHVVVCGWNGSGPAVLLELLGPWSPADRAVVLLTEGKAAPDDLPADKLRMDRLYHVSGDYTRVEVLEGAGVRHAKRAILLADRGKPRSDQDRDARTVLAALTIERLAPHIFTCAELTNRDNASLLKLAGVEEIVVGDWYAGVILGSASRNPGLLQVLDEILTTAYGNAFHSTAVPPSAGGATIAELHQRLLRDHAATLISVEREGAVTVNPAPTETVRAGDTLVVLAKEAPRW